MTTAAEISIEAPIRIEILEKRELVFIRSLYSENDLSDNLTNTSVPISAPSVEAALPSLRAISK